jgi:phospho-N-acetylmuramoyl-pentapeptide-transferase
MIIVSAVVALILALAGMPLAMVVFSRRGPAKQAGETGAAPRPAGRGMPAIGGAVIVIAALIGYVAGHLLTGSPATVAGSQVLALMTVLGLAGLAGDLLASRRPASRGPRGGRSAGPWPDRLLVAAAALALTGYVLIVNYQLRAGCVVLLTRNCYLVRNPLDLAVAAAAVLGGCIGFLCWSARRARIVLGATGTFALGGVLAGLAAATQTPALATGSGLAVIITLAVMRWSGYRPAR